jgi:hypothetical protein
VFCLPKIVSAIRFPVPVLFSVLLSLSACGKHSGPVSEGFQPRNVKIVEDARSAARAGRLYCPYEGECNPAVALISVVTSEGLERCSGVLISPDEVLTNDHCVNHSLSLSGWETVRKRLPCQDNIFVHFAGQSDRGTVDVGCSEVSYRSGESGIASKDYAVIKLNRRLSDIEPVKLSSRGFMDGETSVIYRVQMGTFDGVYGGNQDRLECQASYGTFLYQKLQTPDSPLMTFGDCAIQAGNSGSPIFNQNGEMGALVQGYLTVLHERIQIEDLSALLLDGVFGEVGIGTQAACMAELNPARAAVCLGVFDLEGVQPRDFVNLNKPFDAQMLPKSAKGWNWKSILGSQELKPAFFYGPECASESGFQSKIIQFEKGINRRFQVDWRETGLPGGRSVEFTPVGTQTGAYRSFKSPGNDFIEIPACIKN